MRTILKGAAALITLSILVPACGDETGSVTSDPARSAGASASPRISGAVTSRKTRVVAGQSLTFVKLIDEDGAIRRVVLDEDGDEIEESALPHAPRSKISGELRAAMEEGSGSLSAGKGGELLDVVVALVEVPDTDPDPVEWGESSIDDKGEARLTMNGVAITEEEMLAANEAKRKRIAARRNARVERHREDLRALGEGRPHLSSQPGMVEAMTNGRAVVTLTLTADEIEGLLREHDRLIAGVELAHEAVPLLAQAMLDTKVDPYALDYSLRRGDGIGIYMSETGCPAAGHITNYTRIDNSAADSHNENTSAIIRGVSPDSWVYCRGGYTLPTSADLDGYSGHPPVYIETHSWGYVDPTADYDVNDRAFDDHVYDNAVAVFNAAGNLSTSNNPDNRVMSPARALNVTTVGNYDDATDTISTSSGYIDSNIGNAKPELSAPGTSITAGGHTLSGTSMASPHAAGFGADLMGAHSSYVLRPQLLKAAMLAGSDKGVSGGADKVGVGGLDFYRAYYNGVWVWWEGSNGSFSGFDANDYLPNNGYIDRSRTLEASLSNVRVAIAWQNRGSYTYDHRADADPIGIDLDLCVFDPNDHLVGCSTDTDNPYELVSFNPVITGTYRFRISRAANRDLDSALRLGLAIDW